MQKGTRRGTGGEGRLEGEWMGWFVPNNDIGYLICNRRQYRLATPHFIPSPLLPVSSLRVVRVLSLARSGATPYILYVPVYMDRVPIGPQDKVVDSECHLYGASVRILSRSCCRIPELVVCSNCPNTRSFSKLPSADGKIESFISGSRSPQRRVGSRKQRVYRENSSEGCLNALDITTAIFETREIETRS